jgi:hypothetical protein
MFWLYILFCPHCKFEPRSTVVFESCVLSFVREWNVHITVFDRRLLKSSQDSLVSVVTDRTQFDWPRNRVAISSRDGLFFSASKLSNWLWGSPRLPFDGFRTLFYRGKEACAVRRSPHFSVMPALRWVAPYFPAPYAKLACTFITLFFTAWKRIVLWKLLYIGGMWCCLLARTFTDVSGRDFKCYVAKEERSERIKFNYVLYGPNFTKQTSRLITLLSVTSMEAAGSNRSHVFALHQCYLQFSYWFCT